MRLDGVHTYGYKRQAARFIVDEKTAEYNTFNRNPAKLHRFSWNWIRASHKWHRSSENQNSVYYLMIGRNFSNNNKMSLRTLM